MAVFFSVCSWSYTNSERKKLKKAINFTGSGLLWTQLGLCILHSVGVRVELIKDADILVKFCLNLMIFFQIIESLSPLCLYIRTLAYNFTQACPYI